MTSAAFEADLATGHFYLPTCNLASVLIEAKRLSASHSTTGGHRAFDILHVATGLHLGACEFLTFDTKSTKVGDHGRPKAGPVVGNVWAKRRIGVCLDKTIARSR